MTDPDKFKEICELLKIWFYLINNNVHWPAAKAALEGRINLLCEEQK